MKLQRPSKFRDNVYNTIYRQSSRNILDVPEVANSATRLNQHGNMFNLDTLHISIDICNFKPGYLGKMVFTTAMQISAYRVCL